MVTGEGDKVGMLADFDAGTLEYFLNGQSMGVAFTDLKGPCHFAISAVDRHTITLLPPTGSRSVSVRTTAVHPSMWIERSKVSSSV